MKLNYLFVLIVFAAILFAASPAGAGEETDGVLGGSEFTSDTEAALVTIEASGDGSYYLAEEIVFQGKNTLSENIYMFLTGPNLDKNGVKPDSPLTQAVTGDDSTFIRAAADETGKWYYPLDTSHLDLLPGTYTIYAVSEPKNKADLSGKIYDTVSIVIKRPFITARLSEPVIKAGEEIKVTGTAEGAPQEVGIWIFGFNYWNGANTSSMVTVAPEDDASFEYVLSGEETADMDEGEYIVIVQHPMYNNMLSVDTRIDDGKKTIYVTERESEDENQNRYFAVWGDGALRGTDAADALLEVINHADVDDTYAKTTFDVEGSLGIKPDKGKENSGKGIFESIGDFFAGIFGLN